MSSKRLYFVLISGIVVLFVAMLAGAYGIDSLLAGRATKLTQAKAKNQALNEEQLSLANAKKEVAKYSDLEQIAKTVVPQDKDQAQAVREIVNIAAANNVSLASITFPASTLGNLPVSTGAGVAAATTPVKVSSSAGKLSQLQAVKNIPGVYSLQLTVQSDPNAPVTYNAFINFLDGLEHNRRTAQISSISLAPDAKNSNLLTFTLVLNEYIKP